MAKRDGGPAYPCEHEVWVANAEHAPRWVTQNGTGMSLRDWFAGQALTGWLSGDGLQVSTKNNTEVVGAVARSCFAFADAMLAEREKP